MTALEALKLAEWISDFRAENYYIRRKNEWAFIPDAVWDASFSLIRSFCEARVEIKE